MRYLTKGLEVYHKVGDLIYKEGDPIGESSVYYVVTGSVKLVKTMTDGTEFVYVSGPEDVFGVVSAMCGPNFEETAIALEHCQLYAWDRTSFEACVSLYIEFARLAVVNLSRYLRAVNKELGKVAVQAAGPPPAYQS
jgi:CRP-like cAMP-binding protein